LTSEARGGVVGVVVAAFDDCRRCCVGFSGGALASASVKESGIAGNTPPPFSMPFDPFILPLLAKIPEDSTSFESGGESGMMNSFVTKLIPVYICRSTDCYLIHCYMCCLDTPAGVEKDRTAESRDTGGI
jgi:hypothetical protein